MSRGFTPSRHVFLDPFVIGHDLQDLSQRQLFDLLGRHDDRHRTKVTQCIEFDIGVHYEDTFVSVDGSNEQVDAALLGFRQIRGHTGELIDPIDQRVLGNAHEPHRRRAGDKPHVQLEGRLH
jgi:hypothetical protein